MTATFQATLIEVVKVHARDAFMLAQPPLTRAAKFIFVKHVTVSGEGDWLYKYKSYLGQSMQPHAVDDGRALDMCGGLHPHQVAACLPGAARDTKKSCGRGA
jgi:hypothetical protein